MTTTTKHTCTHVDTCLPCYVLDHCNGDDEFLLGVPVDGASTVAAVRDALLSELSVYELPPLFSHGDARVAINDLFNVPEPAKLFAVSLAVLSEADYAVGFEDCYAWFRLSVG